MPSPLVEDAAHWQAALELYDADLVCEALAQIESRGIGEGGTFMRWYRVIEAEAVARSQSSVHEVNSWLSVETIPTETLGTEEALSNRILAACEQTALKFDWDHDVPTRISILSRESEAPWAMHPHGYWVSKSRYDKICLPFYLLDDLDELSGAVAHEYAHVISSYLSDEQAPRWLEEALSVIAEQDFDTEIARQFQRGELPWLAPEELELCLMEKAAGEDVEVFHAYQQAGWIGRYLQAMGGDEKLIQLLKEHRNQAFFTTLQLSMLGKNRAEGALDRVYGFKSEELFKRTLYWLKQN